MREPLASFSSLLVVYFVPIIPVWQEFAPSFLRYLPISAASKTIAQYLADAELRLGVMGDLATLAHSSPLLLHEPACLRPTGIDKTNKQFEIRGIYHQITSGAFKTNYGFSSHFERSTRLICAHSH